MSTAEQYPVFGSRGTRATPYQSTEHPPPSRACTSTCSNNHAIADPDFNENFDISVFCHAHDEWEPHSITPKPANYTVPKAESYEETHISQPPQKSYVPANEGPNGIANSGEACTQGYRGQAHIAEDPLGLQLSGCFGASENSFRKQRTLYHPENSLLSIQPAISKYEPYSARFDSSERASMHRKQATRFDRKPYRAPDSDYTIAEVERNRLYHVERVYNAMTRGDVARDNKGSIAMKRWVHGAYYNSWLVEAYAHKVLDCLLFQTKEGFRGWIHNDYVADDRKGDDEDRDVTCQERLESIIKALEEEKTICEDVMNSACQIRMFVNAPKAYANRKYQNRVGNSKRGRTKDPIPGGISLKVRKLDPKPVPTTHRPGLNKANEIKPNVRPQSQSYGTSPLPQSHARLTTPYTESLFTGPPPEPYPTQEYLSIQSCIHSKSPSHAGSPYPRSIPAMPPQRHAPLMSPLVLSHGINSGSAHPEDEQLIHPCSELWPTAQRCPDVHHSGDLPLADGSWPSAGIRQGQACSQMGTNLFAQHPELAAFDPNSTEHFHGAYQDLKFPGHWGSHDEIQQFTLPETSDARKPN